MIKNLLQNPGLETGLENIPGFIILSQIQHLQGFIKNIPGLENATPGLENAQNQNRCPATIIKELPRNIKGPKIAQKNSGLDPP